MVRDLARQRDEESGSRHGVFLNDQWRLSDRFSFNLGVRWDKNAARDGAGVTRADDSTFSPRLGVTWDVTGRGKMRLAATYAKYVGANAARLLAFDPFTENPVQGPRPAAGGVATTNWDYGPNFGKARNAADYQLPRTFQISVGARF